MGIKLLKPCPLCGGAAQMHTPPLAYAYRVSCVHCRCNTGGYTSQEEARSAWNQRALEEENDWLLHEIAWLKSCLNCKMREDCKRRGFGGMIVHSCDHWEDAGTRPTEG